MVHYVIEPGLAGDGFTAPEALALRDDVAALNAGLVVLSSRTLDSRDYPNLQAFLDDVSATGIQGRIYPGTYQLTAPLNVGSNTHISAYGAVFECYDTNLYSSNTFGAMFDIYGDRVTIEGGVYNGRKSAFAHTEFKYGLATWGAKYVTLRDIHVYDCKGDGIFIGGRDFSTTPIPSKWVTVENCYCLGNYRQGMSIVFAEFVTVNDSRFTGTAGTDPQFGVDIEPWPDLEWVTDVTFNNCEFDNNASCGIGIQDYDFTAPTAKRITINGGTAHNNADAGVLVRGGADITINGMASLSNTVDGVRIHDSDRIRIGKMHVYGNGGKGIWVKPNSGDSGNPATCNDITIHDCIVETNGSYGILAYDGTVNGLSLTNNTTRGNTGPGFQTEAAGGITAVNRLHVSGNNFEDNAYLGVATAIKRVYGNMGIADTTSG